MDLIVVGANGLLGSNVVQAGLEKGWTVSGTFHTENPDFDIPLTQLDITNIDRALDIIESHDPDWVVNCAAMTDVDECERSPELAREINTRAPAEIASDCNERGWNFLHVSTDYVFDGKSPEPYQEDATTNPVQIYGESKLNGEVAVREVMSDTLITRLSFVYGIHQGTRELTGFPAWVRDRLSAGDETVLFTDQHVTPSRVGQTAEMLCELIELDARGTFNVSCRSCVSPYEFGEIICNEMNTDRSLLMEGKQFEVERPAARPSNTCLDVRKLEQALGRKQPTLTEDVASILDWFESTSGR